MYDERICHLRPDACYYAHLSAYRFALPYCKDRIVLDAGSGSGYGSAYLAEHGASSVCGIDIDIHAIDESRRFFPRDNLKYEVHDLSNITGFPEHQFDVIFSSNALEHTAGVERFFRAAWKLLNPAGSLIVIVPVARDAKGMAEELSNPHHINIWSPRQWQHVQLQYFSEVRCFAHLLVKTTSANAADAVPKETDYSFPEDTIENLNTRNDSYSAIFVSSKPVAESQLPRPDQSTEFIDHSISRPLRPGWMHPFMWAYYRSVYVARYEGIPKLFAKAFAKLRKAR